MKTLIFTLMAIFAAASLQCRRPNVHQVTFRDTLTVLSREVKVDTVAHISSITRDTLVVTKENVTTKVFVHKDSVHVFSHARPQILTRYVERKVSVTCPEKGSWQLFKENWWVLLLAVNVGFLLFALVFKRK